MTLRYPYFDSGESDPPGVPPARALAVTRLHNELSRRSLARSARALAVTRLHNERVRCVQSSRRSLTHAFSPAEHQQTHDLRTEPLTSAGCRGRRPQWRSMSCPSVRRTLVVLCLGTPGRLTEVCVPHSVGRTQEGGSFNAYYEALANLGSEFVRYAPCACLNVKYLAETFSTGVADATPSSADVS